MSDGAARPWSLFGEDRSASRDDDRQSEAERRAYAMMRFITTVFAVAAALMAALPAIAEAGKSLNHNATLLRE
jgi:hypothetical protein